MELVYLPTSTIKIINYQPNVGKKYQSHGSVMGNEYPSQYKEPLFSSLTKKTLLF